MSFRMMTIAQQLKSEIEATAQALGLAPSTVGMRVGQGGKFYERLAEGRRVWPETAAAVRERLAALRSTPVEGGDA